MKYNRPLPGYGDLMTVAEYRENVESGCLMDYDGHGHPVKDNMLAIHFISPDFDNIPADATHILWFNR